MNDSRMEAPRSNDDATFTAGMDTWDDTWDRPGAWDVVLKDLKRLKWLDERVYDLALKR